MDENEDTLPALLSADLERFFYRLVLCYQDRLYAFALRLSNSTQDADEPLILHTKRARCSQKIHLYDAIHVLYLSAAQDLTLRWLA